MTSVWVMTDWIGYMDCNRYNNGNPKAFPDDHENHVTIGSFCSTLYLQNTIEKFIPKVWDPWSLLIWYNFIQYVPLNYPGVSRQWGWSHTILDFGGNPDSSVIRDSLPLGDSPYCIRQVAAPFSAEVVHDNWASLFPFLLDVLRPQLHGRPITWPVVDWSVGCVMPGHRLVPGGTSKIVTRWATVHAV